MTTIVLILFTCGTSTIYTWASYQDSWRHCNRNDALFNGYTRWRITKSLMVSMRYFNDIHVELIIETPGGNVTEIWHFEMRKHGSDVAYRDVIDKAVPYDRYPCTVIKQPWRRGAEQRQAIKRGLNVHDLKGVDWVSLGHGKWRQNISFKADFDWTALSVSAVASVSP